MKEKVSDVVWALIRLILCTIGFALEGFTMLTLHGKIKKLTDFLTCENIAGNTIEKR